MSLQYFELDGKVEEYDVNEKYLIAIDTVSNELLNKTKKLYILKI